jgi:hypothetical protein
MQVSLGLLKLIFVECFVYVGTKDGDRNNQHSIFSKSVGKTGKYAQLLPGGRKHRVHRERVTNKLTIYNGWGRVSQKVCNLFRIMAH